MKLKNKQKVNFRLRDVDFLATIPILSKLILFT